MLYILANARIVYERGVEYYGEHNMDEKLFIAFARFEEALREVNYYFLFVVVSIDTIY